MSSVIKQVEAKYKKKAVVDVRSGDSVNVHQKIVEGGKERVQIFKGLVILAKRKNSLTSSFTVRHIASGVGVEKSFLIHSPSILKIEVTKRSKVRRNYLTYMRNLTGKSTRLSGVDFDKTAINTVEDQIAEAEEAKIHEAQAEAHEAEEAAKAKDEEKQELKVEEAIAGRKDKAEASQEKSSHKGALKNPEAKKSPKK